MKRTPSVPPLELTDFGTFLKYLRRRAGLTQTEVADACGYSTPHISRLENNKRSPDQATLLGLFVPALGLEHEPELVSRLLKLARTAHDKQSDIPIEPQLIPIQRSLPTYPMRFIGRQSELMDISRLLENPDCRLLTLVGIGGIGKTRLAVEVAAALTPVSFPNGVHFVALQPLTSPDLIVSAITEAVQLPFYTDQEPKEHLLQYLQDKTLLLLLDNFEHLLEDVSFVSNILDFAPNVKFLITSRERINLREEWVFEIGGLSFPADEAELKIENYSAVQLFVQHAQHVSANFRLTETQMQGVNRICHIVSGMPLALELAATWLRMMTCAEIAHEIERGLDILETTNRNVPVRHRNMRVVLDYSWGRLTEDEQRVLMQLSVFQGGFMSEAAKAVTRATRQILSALVDKSWLRWDGEVGRYDIHELLRQYSDEKLETTGETESIRQAHAEYFGGFMEARERDLKFRRQVEALADIQRDFANVRSAWGWSMENRSHQVIYHMAEALNFFCDMNVRYIEGEEIFRTASECFVASNDPEVRLAYNRLRARRIRMILQGEQRRIFDREALMAEIETIVAENRTYDNPAEMAFSIYIQGQVLGQMVARSMMLPFFEESFRIFQQINDPFYMAELLNFISLEQQSPIDSARQALALQRDIGDEYGLGWTLLALAYFALRMHQVGEAERYAEEALASQRRRRDAKGLWATMMFSGDLARTKGEFEKALSLAEECFQNSITMNIGPFTTAAQIRLGLTEIIAEKDWRHGKKLCLDCFSFSVASPYSYDGLPPEFDAAFALAVTAYLEDDFSSLQTFFREMLNHIPDYWSDHAAYQLSRIGPIGFLILDREGQTQQAVEVAARVYSIPQAPYQPVVLWLEKWPLLKRLRKKWKQQLGKDEYAAAWERGERLDIAETVQRVQAELTHFP